MVLGALMIDVEGQTLSAEEQLRLQHPLVGGVILFSRNYASPAQMTALTAEIRALRKPSLLIAVDHEGGKVQRFRQEFSPLPPAACIGALYDQNPQQGIKAAQQIGWLLAAELRAVGVDLSFAPVLDLRKGISSVIQDRAFHADPQVVTLLAAAFIQGMQSAGMQAVGKHYPGHGSVAADSHLAVPIDWRSLDVIVQEDLIPFSQLIKQGLPALMPAHVIYPQIDKYPAVFSKIWLTFLRQQLRFTGAIFSDDLNMAAAGTVGDMCERVPKAIGAGCDMLLICNNSDAVGQVLETFCSYEAPQAQARVEKLRGTGTWAWQKLHTAQAWQEAQQQLEQLQALTPSIAA